MFSGYLYIAAAVTHCIVDQVGHHALCGGGLQGEWRQRPQMCPDRLTAAREAFAYAGHDVVQIFAWSRWFIAPFPREIEELVDDGIHILDILDHPGLQSIVE